MRRAAIFVPFLFASMTAQAACDAPEHRQFDFWLGEWEVVAPEGTPNAGKLLGHNRIDSLLSGCGLQEHWSGAGGVEGKSLNAWDPARKAWRQFWIGSDGLVLELTGALQGKAMVMTGELPAARGGTQRQRVSWTPREDGSVVQLWEASDDAGNTWKTSFHGLYRRKPAP
jgi:hypothetical protein